MSTKNDIKYMKLALSLAARALGHTSPNPMVGCVIVKNNSIISTGYHKKAGMPHAEAEALKKAGSRAKGAALYVNLEPCSHAAKLTPPCADDIIRRGVREVVAAVRDPNPAVSGRGFARLRKNGVKVRTGVLGSEAEALNAVFFKNMRKRAPYVYIKAGMSADGKIALKNRRSKWITSRESREHSQELRKRCDAILVGINTILADDPYLDCRIDSRKRIKKVILDSRGRTPADASLFKRCEASDVFIFTAGMKKAKIKMFKNKGVNVIMSKISGGMIPCRFVLRELFRRGVMSVLVEGGAGVASSFLKDRLVDEAHFYIAPKIIGSDGLSYFGEMGFRDLRRIFRLVDTSVTRIKDDILLKGKVKYV
jgi:diaminohydroxyphosphoribosylaminopyrimidine deaminase/5-amino-6-(5-phosphoribosylamino)uracil reductase